MKGNRGVRAALAGIVILAAMAVLQPDGAPGLVRSTSAATVIMTSATVTVTTGYDISRTFYGVNDVRAGVAEGDPYVKITGYKSDGTTEFFVELIDRNDDLDTEDALNNCYKSAMLAITNSDKYRLSVVFDGDGGCDSTSSDGCLVETDSDGYSKTAEIDSAESDLSDYDIYCTISKI